MFGGRSGHFQLGGGTAKTSEKAFKRAHEGEMGLSRQDAVWALPGGFITKSKGTEVRKSKVRAGKSAQFLLTGV